MTTHPQQTAATVRRRERRRAGAALAVALYAWVVWAAVEIIAYAAADPLHRLGDTRVGVQLGLILATQLMASAVLRKGRVATSPRLQAWVRSARQLLLLVGVCAVVIVYIQTSVPGRYLIGPGLFLAAQAWVLHQILAVGEVAPGLPIPLPAATALVAGTAMCWMLATAGDPVGHVVLELWALLGVVIDAGLVADAIDRRRHPVPAAAWQGSSDAGR